MAVLISAQTGNFTSSSSWYITESAAGSQVDSEAGTTTLTTTPVDSATWTPGAGPVYHGILIKIATRAASPTGTLIVVLRNTTDGVNERTVTITASEIAYSGVAGNNKTWVYAKFSSTYATVAGKNYAVRLSISGTPGIDVFRNATSNNHSRFIATTTNGTPAAGDQFHIVGHQAGGGPITPITITMDNTAATIFGSIGPVESLSINHGGTLTWGTAGSTNYLLTIRGVMRVMTGGIHQCGTSGTRIPSSSTATLQFSHVTSLTSLLNVGPGAICEFYGTRPSRHYSLMTVDAAAAATSVTVADASGWSGTGRIAIAPTRRTSSEGEIRDLTSIAGNVCNFTTGLSFPHSGNATGGPNSVSTQAEVVYLTRNVMIFGVNNTNFAYVTCELSATVVFDSVYFKWMGGTGTNGAISLITLNTGSALITYCSFEGSTSSGCRGISTFNDCISLTASYNVSYGMSPQVLIGVTSVGTLSVSESVAIGTSVSSAGSFNFTDRKPSLTNVRASGGSAGISIVQAITASGTQGTWSDWVVHSTSGNGITAWTLGSLSNVTSWRCAGIGLDLIVYEGSTLSNITLFGNSSLNVRLSNSATGTSSVISNLIANSEASFVTTQNIQTTTATGSLLIKDSAFSNVTAPSFGDMVVGTTGNQSCTFYNTSFGATPITASTSAILQTAYQNIVSIKHGGVSGDNRAYVRYGWLRTDTTIYSTASPSIRITPLIATGRVQAIIANVAVASGGNPTVSIKVRESVVGDGTDYNGVRARLCVRANPLAGIASDTVIATATSSSQGAWETLSGSVGAVSDNCVLEFYVDCGFTGWTAGWVNVDDFTCSTTADTKDLKYWSQFGVFVVGDNVSGGGGGGGWTGYSLGRIINE